VLWGVLKEAAKSWSAHKDSRQGAALAVGKQEMVGAIDAVCDVAERIINKLKKGATAGGPSLLGSAGNNGTGLYPPTPAMKRFADSLVRQKEIKPPPGYKTSISICRKFLSEHAPKKSDGEPVRSLDPKPVSPAQSLYAKKLAQGKVSSSPMMQGPTRSRCPRGLTRTEAQNAARVVAKPPKGR